jgi:hypothetical protein
MRLISENIEFRVGNEKICLKPTLRAAYLIVEQFGSFEAVIQGVRESNLGVITAIIRASHPSSRLEETLSAFDQRPVLATLKLITLPVLAHVFALMGIDPAAKDDAVSTVSDMTFGEYHERLFKIGTGWLGWTPEDTWDCAPAEIVAAYKGRCDMLGSIFGAPEAERPKISIDDQFRAVMTSVIARKQAQKAT